MIPAAQRVGDADLLMTFAARDLQVPPAPDRVRSPFYPQHPHVDDPASLKATVQDDPQHIFGALMKLVQARDFAFGKSDIPGEKHHGAKERTLPSIRQVFRLQA
jgi:hypothetical protein